MTAAFWKAYLQSGTIQVSVTLAPTCPGYLSTYVLEVIAQPKALPNTLLFQQGLQLCLIGQFLLVDVFPLQIRPVSYVENN